MKQWYEENDEEIQHGLYWRQAFDVQWELPGDEPPSYPDNLLGVIRFRGVPQTTNTERQPKKSFVVSCAAKLALKPVRHVRVMVGSNPGLLLHPANEGRRESNLHITAG